MMRDIVENDGWTRLPAVNPDGQPTSNAVAATGERDAHGRFLAGNSGGGRRKGSRNKLTERFLDAIADDFLEHGPEAIAKVRTDDPAMYLKLVGSLVPRELILEREQAPPIDCGEITDEELAEAIDRLRRQRLVESVWHSIK